MFAGQPAFAARSARAMVAAQIAEMPVHLASRTPAMPPALPDLVMRAIAKNPDDRPQSADEIVRTLDSINLSGESSLASGADAPRGSRGAASVVAAGAGAAAVVLLVAGGFWIRSRAATARVGPRAELLTLAALPLAKLGTAYAL